MPVGLTLQNILWNFSIWNFLKLTSVWLVGLVFRSSILTPIKTHLKAVLKPLTKISKDCCDGLRSGTKKCWLESKLNSSFCDSMKWLSHTFPKWKLLTLVQFVWWVIILEKLDQPRMWEISSFRISGLNLKAVLTFNCLFAYLTDIM